MEYIGLEECFDIPELAARRCDALLGRRLRRSYRREVHSRLNDFTEYRLPEMELLGTKWAGAGLRALFTGSHRFADIKAAIPHVSDTMLTQRLRDLERVGLLERRVVPSFPVHVEYELTQMGREVEPVLDAVIAWSHKWIAVPDGADDDASHPDRRIVATGPPEPVAGLENPRGLGWALALISTAQFVLQLDFSIVGVALPTIQRDLHMAPADLQWIVTGYALTFGSLLLLGGRLGDIGGHRRLLIIGLVCFGVTSLGAGLAQTSTMLIVARFAQGASAAIVAPQALAALTDLYDDGSARTRAMGIFQGATAAGASAGIVLGGILTQYIGWRSIFLVNPPVIIMLVVLMHRALPHDTPKGHEGLDLGGALLVTTSVAVLIYALSQGQQHGFAAPVTIAALLIAVLLAVTFVVVERRVQAPIVPFNVLADPGRRASLTVMLLMGAVVAGYVYFTSLYLQEVLHFDAVLTGLALIPATATVMITSILLNRPLLNRFGTKKLLLLATVPAGLSTRSTTSATAGDSGLPAITIAPGTITAGSRASSKKVQTKPVSSSSFRSAVMSTVVIVSRLGVAGQLDCTGSRLADRERLGGGSLRRDCRRRDGWPTGSLQPSDHDRRRRVADGACGS